MKGEVERERLRIMIWSGWFATERVHLNKYPEFDGELAAHDTGHNQFS